MPIHDWTRVGAGTFHNFHLHWIVTLMDDLNAGLLPKGYLAMAERIGEGFEGDVASSLNLEERYAAKANRISIQRGLGHVVSIIEIVSPGSKKSAHAIHTFREKAVELIRSGVNLLVIDIFPPGPRDPQGIHKVIWDEVTGNPSELPPGKRLTLASYHAAPIINAYVEPVAVGDRLPDMPLFLGEDWYVNVPLEQTYTATWNVLPAELRALLEPPG